MKRLAIFFVFFPLLVVSIILWPKLPTQDIPGYFDFAGTRMQNVLSNIPFFFVALIGFLKNKKRKDNLGLATKIFCLGLFLTAFGSAYFHWNPNPQTLFWDRLPMSIAFAGMISIITIDRLYPKLTFAKIYLMTLISILTVVNWTYGNNDLRPYLILQFVGSFYLLLVTACSKSNVLKNKTVYLSIFFYGLAKVFEVFDKEIYAAIGITNGHTLKHLSAAFSAYFLLP